MITVEIPNRPFAAEPITGLMLPDGIFEASLGTQTLNAGVRNSGGSNLGAFELYVESVSHPGIVVQPQTYPISSLPAGASRTMSWNVNVAAAPPGVHQISFVARRGTDVRRIIKKIFVTRIEFDPSSATFRAFTPEGTFDVQFHDFVKPRQPCCLPTLKQDPDPHQDDRNFIRLAAAAYKGHDPRFVFCPPGYLPRSLNATVTPVPGYGGQYGDLPFEDPWWKIILCIIVVILLIAAAIVAAANGDTIFVTGGTPDPSGSPAGDCCGVRADGGSSSYVAAGLVAAAAAVATAAAFSDVRDPLRRGQDNTVPASAGELTTSEALKALIEYPEPIRPGHPFAVAATWNYTRTTSAASYDFAAQDVNQNIHVISRYQIQAPNVIRLYRREQFLITAEFFGRGDEKLHGDQLFVQCILAGPSGQYRRFLLQDDGLRPDTKPNDGIYTGIYDFTHEKPDPRGFWHVYVIAQDVNRAQPNLPPEEAAKIIGGMVLTDQVSIDFQGGTCPLVPDGDLHVI